MKYTHEKVAKMLNEHAELLEALEMQNKQSTARRGSKMDKKISMAQELFDGIGNGCVAYSLPTNHIIEKLTKNQHAITYRFIDGSRFVHYFAPRKGNAAAWCFVLCVDNSGTEGKHLGRGL